MRRFRLWLWPSLAAVTLIGIYSCSSSGGGGISVIVPEPASLSIAPVAQVASTVTNIVAAPGDTGRIFVVEQTGAFRIVKHGVLLARPFLDLSAQVLTAEEDGALGIAFPGDYAVSGIFYVSYTSTANDIRVTRFHVSANPDSADPNSGSLVFSYPLRTNIHHAGHISFGPDGKFYIAIGDGGPENDPNHSGQDRTDLYGSILRLNVGSSGTYTVPNDNPFVGIAGLKGELWDYGLRNPGGWSFDRGTGDLYIADVGQDAWEEVDAAPVSRGMGRGANYGWSILEGRHCGPGPGCDSTGKTMPVIEYAHNSGAGECAVVGGVVYRGRAIPGIAGLYFYTDLCGAWVRSFRLMSAGATEQKDWGITLPDSPITIGEDANGEIYFGTGGGQVLKLKP